MPCTSETSCDEQPLRHPSESVKQSCVAICSKTGRRCRNCPKVWMPTASLVLPLKGCCTLCNVHAKIAKTRLMTLVVSTTGTATGMALGATLTYDEYILMTNKVNGMPSIENKLIDSPYPNLDSAVGNAKRGLSNWRKPKH